MTVSFFVLSPLLAQAFPELIRHGYNTCVACHLSPTGGGLLTPYGRKLAAEVLTTWGSEATTGVTWGLTDQEKQEAVLWLGGDIRRAQVHQENAAVRTGRFIAMQTSISAAWVLEKWAFLFELGKEERDQWQPHGTTFWAKYEPTEGLSIRAGRFVPAYGLHISDHIAFIRSFTGFGLEAGRDSVETRYANENASISLTLSKEAKPSQAEQAVGLSADLSVSEHHVLGANIWRGDREGDRRTLAGVWGSIGLGKSAYYLGELDWQNRDGLSTTASFITYHRLGYSVFKGLDVFALYERQEGDLNRSSTSIERRGPGIQWTPLPHVDITGAWTKQRLSSPDPMEEDYAWLVLHYWL